MTRLLITTAIIAALASPAYAGDHSPSGNTYNQGGNAFAGAAAGAAASSRSAATAGGGAGGQGGSGGSANSGATVNNNNNVSAGNGNGGGWNGGPGQWPASSAYAPSYALGSMCQEATSGGVSIFWAGISGGGVRTMEFCKVAMKADHFRKIGREDMAKLMECGNDELRSAYKTAGTPCPADVPKEQAQPQPQASRVLNAGGLQCFDAQNNPVALGQPGSVRCQ